MLCFDGSDEHGIKVKLLHKRTKHTPQPLATNTQLAQEIMGSVERAAASVLLRALLTSAVLVTAFWLAAAGTRRWRDNDYWRSFPPDFG